MDDYTVILRRYSEESESDKYYPIGTEDSLKLANRFAENIVGEPGDIVIVCDTAKISDMSLYAREIYIADEKGRSRMPLRPRSGTSKLSDMANWIYAWESIASRADYMIWNCYHFDINREIVSKIIVECAKEMIANNKTCSLTARHVIEVCDEFLSGRASRNDVNKARDAVYYLMDPYNPNSDTAAHATITHITGIYADPTYTLRSIAYAASNFEVAIRELSNVVRNYVPMKDIMLAAVKKTKAI